ncbi:MULTISPECIES: phage tail protein [unclassified Pseudomonas]|uniref:phage tail protein n=1 Tax=unclassified Pseudomonas TaxID=196821 RepID=UPI00128E148D|nr:MULTISPECIES: phage tail protein [unclassified Pseudomonas]MPQ67112.1 phage tail protein [Pseudomonas sp. MWU12-2323]
MATTNNTLTANTQTVVNMALVVNGVQKMDDDLSGVSKKVESFKKSLEDSGLGELDLSELFKGEGLAAPFVEGVKSAIEAENKLAEARKGAEGSDSGPTAKNLASLSEAVDKVSLKFGQALLPVVNSVVTALVPLVSRVAEFVAANPNLVQGLAAGAVAFTVLQGAVAGVAAVVGVLASPIGLVVVGFALAAALIVAYWKPISGFFIGLWGDIKGMAASFMSGLQALLDWSPMPMISAGWETISVFFAGLWQSITTAAASVFDFFKELFSWTPLGLVIDNWGAVTGLFDSIWRLLKALAVPVMDFLKGVFDWSPLGLIINNWGAISAFFGELWDTIKVASAPAVDFLKMLFDWSPLVLVINNWGAISAYFDTIWAALQDTAQSLKDFFQTLFDWSPVGLIVANWEPIGKVFSDLWDVLQSLATPVMDFFQTMFDWSPLGMIIKNWDPIVAWFAGWWSKLQTFITPIKALFSGGFGDFVAKVTGQVDGLAQQQEAGNAKAANDSGSSFWNWGDSSSSSDSGLTGNGSGLVQQTAANNRTQLEGGLTVNFKDAPAGLRVDQAQTNQPGLDLTPRVGYRSLSYGGSYGD